MTFSRNIHNIKKVLKCFLSPDKFYIVFCFLFLLPCSDPLCPEPNGTRPHFQKKPCNGRKSVTSAWKCKCQLQILVIEVFTLYHTWCKAFFTWLCVFQCLVRSILAPNPIFKCTLHKIQKASLCPRLLGLTHEISFSQKCWYVHRCRFLFVGVDSAGPAKATSYWKSSHLII